MKPIDVCPGTLQEGHSTYSTTALRALFNGRKVAHQLTFSDLEARKDQRLRLQEARTRISISGVQEKYSIRQEKNRLLLTHAGGTHILKPIPTGLEHADFVPANEHLTMQIAAQVYKLDVARNGLIFFAGFFEEGTPAYITRRFDVRPDGTRCLKEDFASLLQRTSMANGKNYKYDGSYLQMAEAIDRYIPAALIAKEKLFRQVIFNYLFSNGDAHLKNFSVVDYQQDGLYQLSPAYDLICTRLHIDDSDLALTDELYDGDHEHPSFAHYGCYTYDDFYDFGLKTGLMPRRITDFMALFLSGEEKVMALIARSFLSEDLKQLYRKHYLDKKRRLLTSQSGKL